jgi:hypothetical protein
MEFLLECAREDLRAELAERLRAAGAVFEDEVIARDPGRASAAERLVRRPDLPRIVLGWMVEQDDPQTNAVLYHHELTPTGIRADIRRGLPFRPGREPGAVVPFDTRRHDQWSVDAQYRSFVHLDAVDDFIGGPDRRGLVEQLRRRGEARKLGACREVADAVGREDWGLIAEADRHLPLPGYARWALCVHPMCPEALRGQLGGHLDRFAKRLRRAGIYRDPAELVHARTPASSTLWLLDMGRHVFTGRLGPARELMAELAREQLGTNFEAWAVLAQLLPTFTGTLAELIVTSGAIAGGAGGGGAGGGGAGGGVSGGAG